MTEKQMQHIAGRKLALHWIKLYRPARVIEWARKEKCEELPDEFKASLTAMEFFKGKGSMGYRLSIFIEAIDIRETRQLCLGEAIPDSILDEAVRLKEEAESLFASCAKTFADSSGEQVVFVPA